MHTRGITLDVDKYIDYLNTKCDYLDYFIQVDHIPGEWGKPKTNEQLAEAPIKTWENYLYMRSKVKYRDRLWYVFHQGEDFKYLDQCLNYRDETGEKIKYICISSSKDETPDTRYKWYQLCYYRIMQSSNPEIKIHSLGTQSERHIMKTDFTSADATSWLRTAILGNIITPYGTIPISARTKHKKGHIDSSSIVSTEEVIANVDKYIRESGFEYTLDDMRENSEIRQAWNLFYYGKLFREIDTSQALTKRFIQKPLF